jgi:glycine betaine/proline transport system substrate-binding protein
MPSRTVFPKCLLIGFILAVVLFASVPQGAVAQEKPGEGVTVEPARATWKTGYFLEAIYSMGLEELGYTVAAPRDMSSPDFYKALVQGDLDFWANGWFPLHNSQLPPNFEDRGSLVDRVVSNGAVQGYLVSKGHADRYDITSLEDFKRDEVKQAFDSNDDGKADMVACPEGWGCAKVIAHHMEAYNLKEHINLITSDYNADMKKALKRHSRGEPVLFYTWTPNWTVGKLQPGQDVVWINVPEINPASSQKGLGDAMVAQNLQGAVTSPIRLGYAVNDIRVAANDEFLNNNPAAKKFFQVMEIPLQDIARQNEKMFEGENDQEDIERHAREWIDNNRKFWEDCLEKARSNLGDLWSGTESGSTAQR